MKYNPVKILIIGQTGAGKSSLVNYVLQNEHGAKTDTGFPVTSKGFHLYKGINGEFPIYLYDSWGMEMGKFDEWLKSLKSFVQKQHEIDGVWFCVNSHSHRIQRSELDVINYLISKDVTVTIVLTKATPSQADRTYILQQAIASEIPVIQSYVSVNSVEEQLMTGEQLNTFGADLLKEQLADLMLQKNLESVKERLVEHISRQMGEGAIQIDEIPSYVSEMLALPAIEMFNVLQLEDVNWLHKAKSSWSHKASPFVKKASMMKQIVNRKKQDIEQVEEPNVTQIVNGLVLDDTIKNAIKQAFMEGQILLYEK